MDAQSPAVESCVYNDRTFFGPILVRPGAPPQISDLFTRLLATFTCVSDISSTSGRFHLFLGKANVTDFLFFSSVRPLIPFSPCIFGCRVFIGPSLCFSYPNRTLGLNALFISALKTRRFIFCLIPAMSPLLEIAFRIYTSDLR